MFSTRQKVDKLEIFNKFTCIANTRGNELYSVVWLSFFFCAMGNSCKEMEYLPMLSQTNRPGSIVPKNKEGE